MVRAVSLRLCHGSGGQSTVVPWLGQSVGGCAMARPVSRRLCHGSGGLSAATLWLGRSFGGRAMAQAVRRRPLTASACGTCVEQSAKGVVFSLYFSTAGQYHSTYTLHLF